MTPLATGLLFLGLFLGCLVVAKARDWAPFRITKQPPAVRISPEVLDEMRAEIIHRAIKQQHRVRTGFQRSNFR